MLDVLKKNNGYSLVEVVVAMVGLSLTVLLLGAILTMSVRTTAGARDMDMTLMAARAKLNELLATNELDARDSNDVYRASSGRHFNRTWRFTQDGGPVSPTGSSAIFVEVRAIAQDGQSDAVTISGFIDPDNVCYVVNMSSAIPQFAGIIKDDDVISVSSNTVTVTRSLVFPQNGVGPIQTSDTNFETTLFSITPPAGQNPLDVKDVEITGSDRSRVRSLRNQSISLNASEIAQVRAGSRLRFNVRFVGCRAERRGGEANVEFRFQHKAAPGQGPTPGTGCSPFNATINENIGNQLTESGTLIGEINCNGVFSLSPAPGHSGHFPFTAVGNRILTAFDFNFNFEAVPKWEFTITETTSSVSVSGTVNIRNINEPPTRLAFFPRQTVDINGIIQPSANDAIMTLDIHDTVTAGYHIADLFAFDPDINADFRDYTYTITSGIASQYFQIVSNLNNNAARLTARRDFLNPPSNNFSVEIQATNTGAVGNRSVVATLNVNVISPSGGNTQPPTGGNNACNGGLVGLSPPRHAVPTVSNGFGACTFACLSQVGIEGDKERCEGNTNIGYLTPASWATYNINVTSAGVYRMRLRALSHWPRTITAHIGDIQAERVSVRGINNPPAPTNWWLQPYNWEESPPFVLAAGNNTLRFTFNGDEINLERIEIQTVNFSPPPAGTQTAHTVNSSGTTSIPPCAFVAASILNTGNNKEGCYPANPVTPGHSNHIGNLVNGSWILYNINVAIAGNYRIRLRTGLNATDTRVVTAFIGGREVARFTAVNNGNWGTGHLWTNNSEVFSLSSGAHTLRLSVTGGINISAIELIRQ